MAERGSDSGGDAMPWPCAFAETVVAKEAQPLSDPNLKYDGERSTSSGALALLCERGADCGSDG